MKWRRPYDKLLGENRGGMIPTRDRVGRGLRIGFEMPELVIFSKNKGVEVQSPTPSLSLLQHGVQPTDPVTAPGSVVQ